MNKQQFRFAADLSQELSERWYYPVMVSLEMAEIKTPVRMAHFIAQIGTESGGFKFLLESFNYSVSGLDIFGSRLSRAQKEELGRSSVERVTPLKKQITIANLVYGGRYGNLSVDDGWKYRGRGLIQITFRDNYIACGEYLGLDLIEKPDLLLNPLNAACSSAWFWRNNECNEFADRDDISGLTRIINGGNNGIEDRTKRTLRALSIILP